MMTGNFSVNSPKVVIFGGTGFLGRYIVQRLARQGWIVNVITRNPSEAIFLKTFGHIGQINLVKGNFLNCEDLREKIRDSYAIVNCVGILNESSSQKFKILHTEVPSKLAKYAFELGVEKFIHISSIGANEGSKSSYERTKFVGEKRIQNAFPKAIILRSSLMFGSEDQFFNLFSQMVSFSPLLPIVGGGKTLFQPVYVDDIAHAVEKILQNFELKYGNNNIFELGGSEIMSFRDLMLKMLSIINRKRILFNIPFWVAEILTPFVFIINKLSLNKIPLLITKDQIQQLKKDNIANRDLPGFKELSISPRVLDAILPAYLNRFRPKGQFSDL